jgi:hypothetical protein
MKMIKLYDVCDSLPENSNETDILEAWAVLTKELNVSSHHTTSMLQVLRDVAINKTGDMDPAWGGGWTWNLKEASVRTVINSALLAGVLSLAGVTSIIPLVMPVVLPFLFDFKKVRISRKANKIIEIIGAQENAFKRAGKLPRLYKSLPEDIRAVLTIEELDEFIEEAVDAGVANRIGEVFEVLPNGDTVLRLKIL